LIDAPNINVTSNNPVPNDNLFARNLPIAAPPPIIQTQEQTPPPKEQQKLAFESPSAQVVTGGGGRIPMPSRTSNVDELGKSIASSRGGGLTVGDAVGGGGLGAPTASPTRNQSAVQMMTDPMGIDFRPYLTAILSSVRRNWLAILPESARMGRRGRVQVQFAINRDGSVPKLVISSGSGLDALDRAAVAGISASNPFPPLPPEFQGPQIRLQFTFAYNNTQ
jgi:TonB family protein